MTSTQIFALRKQGRTVQALEQARSEYAQNANDVWLLRAYAWVLYDHAKNIVDAYERKRLSVAELNTQLTLYMREFAKIATPLRGDSAFSQMLRLAGKASKDWRYFLRFSRWAGLSDFSEDDKAPFVNEQGKSIDSLQKRFTRAICRETAIKAVLPESDPALIEWGMQILEQTLEHEPNDQWLNYYQSKLHVVNGEVDLAVKRLMPALRRQSKATWPWALLGDILQANRPDDALCCYIHAVQLAREEQELAKVRIHLAHRLSLVGRFNEAATQAALALEYRELHGFKVPQELQQLINSEWYQQAIADNSQHRLPNVDESARALLRELSRRDLCFTVGIINNINLEKNLSYVATGIDTGIVLLHHKFPQVAELALGTVVEVGQANPEGHALEWRLSETKSISGLYEMLSGCLERQEGRSFAWIRSAREVVFVPPSLASSFADGQSYQVSCLAIKQTNKEGRTGWRAVQLLDTQIENTFLNESNSLDETAQAAA